MSVESKLVVKQMNWSANMTDQNHLGAALIIKPDHFEGKMETLFSARHYFSGNTLSSIIGQRGKVGKKKINGTSWEWELKGPSLRPIVVLKTITANNQSGKYGRTFEMVCDENWYVSGDVMGPGTSDKRYQVRIQKDPSPHGVKGWVYTVKVLSDDPNFTIPDKFLKEGHKWGKLYSAYGEAAEQSGSIQYSTPLGMRNKLGLYRKKYKITNFASTEVLAVSIPDSQGNYHNSWMKYAEVEFWQQWHRELEVANWYSRSTDTTIAANGRKVRLGPGAQEQLEDSHIYNYSRLSTRLMEDYLMGIFYSRIKPSDRKEIKALTGEYGQLEFHRKIMHMMNENGFIKNMEVFTNKVQGVHKNSLEAGFQFTRYNMANGISLEMYHNTLADDTTLHWETDPITGYPMASQRITFLDFVGDAGSANVQMVEKKDGMALIYVEGMYGPYGPKKNKTGAHSGSYYEMHVEKSAGIHIGDVSRCGELILTRA